VTVLLAPLPLKAANTLVMDNSNQMTFQLPYVQDQKSFMLRRHSFSECGSYQVACSFDGKGGQYVGYAY